MVLYTAQPYDKYLTMDTNEICFQCKRCVTDNLAHMCGWHKSKGTVLIPGSVVSDCRLEKKSLACEKEGSYKILRCPKFVPDDSDGWDEMKPKEYKKICEELPDIMFHKIRELRDAYYARGKELNELELKYKKMKDLLDSVVFEYDIHDEDLEKILRKWNKHKNVAEAVEIEEDK